MTRPLQLLTLLSLTTALLSAAPAQAGFEFVSKAAPKPAASAAKPASVPVTNTTPDEDDYVSVVSTPVWTPKAPAPAAAIPLTPVISSSDSFEMIDAPLLPDLEGAVMSKTVGTPVRETLATKSSTTPAPVNTIKSSDVSWDKPAASLPVPEEIVDTKPAVTPEPIVETILETPQNAVAAAPADDAVIEGFGSGLPMVMALRQIVPAHYRFSFGPGIDPGQRISWQGGKKWSEVVADVAQKNGMQSEIAGNVVAIRRSGTSGTAGPASSNMMEDVVMGVDETSAPLPPPMPVQKRTILSSTTLTETTSSKPLPIIEQVKTPTEKEPVSLLAAPAVKPIEDIADDNMPVMHKSIPVADTTLPTPEKPAALPPITEEVSILPAPVASVNVAPQAESKKAPVSINTDMSAKEEWIGRSGMTLRSVLQEWSKQANVSLVWSSDFDYPLQTDIRIEGTYPEAVRTLLAGFGKAQPKPTGRLHKNSGVGAQPVLIIDTPRLING